MTIFQEQPSRRHEAGNVQDPTGGIANAVARSDILAGVGHVSQ